MNCLFNNPFSLSAERSLPLSQPSHQEAQFGTLSGGDTGTPSTAGPTTAAPFPGPFTAPTAGQVLSKDPLVDISLKMLQALEPRLQRRPEVTSFGNFMEAILEELPADLRFSALAEMNATCIE